MTTQDRLRILVLGYVVRCPLGGMTWHYLQYALGLSRLGHDVYFVEDSDDYPSCYDPSRHVIDTDPRYGLRYARQVFDDVGLGDRWAYYDAHTSTWHGPCGERIPELCKDADLVINVSGIVPLRPWLMRIDRRVFVDTDPAFEQVRQLTVPERHTLASRHTAFFSFGENIAAGISQVPDDRLPWRATRQPVVLDAWPASVGPVHGKYTTVMQWDSYPSREYQGRRYGLKGDSFEPFVALPEKAGPLFELALGSENAPRDMLRSHGWALRDPLEPTRTPLTYRDYIRQSKAEFSVAKHGYVTSHCGWFSERSSCYLASGRPVLAQDTGFSEWLETGSGVLAFETLDEAAAGVESVNARYEFHCRAAREVAEEYFDAHKVLSRLVEEAMSDPPPVVKDVVKHSRTKAS